MNLRWIRSSLIAAATFVAIGADLVQAAESLHGARDHSAAADHAAHGAPRSMPAAHGEPRATEAGEAAFAAIAEIVRLLSADPATDWTQVDIDRLRGHLVDMSRVTLSADVRREPAPQGVRFVVSGPGEVAESIRRMTLAHAPFLSALDAWTAHAEATEAGAVLTVTSADPALVARIQALGYFGLMALGAHHQEHHLAMARGVGHP